MIRKLLGLGPVAVPPHVFAIEAGSASYACFPRGPGGMELQEFHRVELAPETFGPGLIGCAVQEERSLREGLDELLSRIGSPVTDATLILPDSWLRIAFTEVDELPKNLTERDEVLRWKLKRLVPFRVEDLRLESMEVEPLAGQREARRLMLGFALEALLGQLESTFSSYGIRIGLVSNVSLALLQAVWEGVGRSGLRAVVSVTEDGYTLAFAGGGRPVLHRFKSGASGNGASKVLRELRLTGAFLAERLPDARLEAIHLHSPEEEESTWSEWLRQGLDADVRPATELAVWSGGSPSDVRGPLPLMGAACTTI